MQKKLLKNSKAGFSLPAAMAITTTLIILSASLIMIALSSISTTTMDVSGRQAYLNIRSALEYAEKYYSSLKDYSELKTAKKEYVYMNDVGGTITEGAEISKNDTKMSTSTTYIIVEYIEMPDNTPDKLRMTAYSKYADSFGQRSKMAQMTVTFAITQSGGSYRRLTVITKPGAGEAVSTGDEIIFNIKQAPDQNWTMAYYAWTFQDKSQIYTKFNSGVDTATANNSDVDYKKTELCDDINATKSSQPALDSVNYNENIGQYVLEPANPWVNEEAAGGQADKIGPGSVAGDNGDGWYTGMIRPQKKAVNYVNVILAKKGAVLSAGDDTQTPEMFHLWYLDKNDRNIYFEFISNNINYYRDSNWNGKTNLEDTVIAYAKNSLTTVHFKSKGLVDDDAVKIDASVSKPVINSVKISGTPISGKSYLTGGNVDGSKPITMTYEGCGWWVATVETGSVFTMEISYRSAAAPYTKTVSVTPNSKKEAWVIADGADLQSRLSEENANIALGIVNGSYITVHARAYNTDERYNPTLDYSYTENFLDLSARKELEMKIKEAQAIESTAYTTDSYKSLTSAVEVANRDYNRNPQAGASTSRVQDIIDNTSLSRSNKMTQLTSIYIKDVEDINAAIDGLVEALVTARTLNDLAEKVTEYEAIKTTETTYDGTANLIFYDYGVYTAQVLRIEPADGSENILNAAKTVINNASPDITEVKAKEYVDLLTEVIDNIKNKTIDKAALKTKINDAEARIYTDIPSKTKNPQYVVTTVEAVEDKITNAYTEYNSKTSTHESYDTAVEDLATAVGNLKVVTIALNTATLNGLITQATNLLHDADPKKGGYTDAGFAQLTAERDAANTVLSSATSQEQIDNEEVKLTNAIRYFITPKPANTPDQLKANNLVRVYIGTSTEEGLENARYTVNLYRADSDEIDRKSLTELSSDSVTGMDYIDLSKTNYKEISVSYDFPENGTKPAATAESNKYAITTYTEGELAIAVLPNTASQKVTSYYGPTMTLYLPKANYNNTSGVPVVIAYDINHPDAKAEQTVITPEAVGGEYYITKTWGNVDTASNIRLEITAGTGENVTKITNINLSNGQFIVKYTSDNTADFINAEEVYPKAVSTGSGAVSLKTVSTAVSTMIEKLMSEASDDTTSSGAGTKVTEVFDEYPSSDNSTIIIVKNTGGHAVLYGWIWPEGGSGDSEGFGNTAYPGKALLRYKDSDYYYTEVPSTAHKMILSKGGSDSDKLTGELVLNDTGTRYAYIILNDSYNGVTRTNTAPNVEVTENTSGKSSVKMVFVGGSKVRFKNYSYNNYYSGKKDQYGNSVDGGRLFGGNDQGSGRVGTTRASAMFDWYEYKLPIDTQNEYAFQIKGLNKDSGSTYTKEIQKAFGDVWVWLKGTEKDGSDYKNFTLTTFDSEYTEVHETTRIYFRKPSDDYSSMKVSYYGIQSGDKNFESANENVAYPYVDIPNGATFLKISVSTTSEGTKTFRTSLQGGDNVLFDPSFNRGLGGWDSYVSPQEQLKREVLKAQTMYYGRTVVSGYDSEGRVKSNANIRYLEKLRDLYKPYTNMTKPDHQDWTLNVGNITSLKISDAVSAYNSLHSYVSAYLTLDSAMSEAKQYLKETLDNSGNWKSDNGYYPEYLSSGNVGVTFKDATITSLKSKFKSAQNEYLNSGTTPGSLKDAATKLRSASASVTVEDSGTVAVVFYDLQKVVPTGAMIKVSWKNDYTGVSDSKLFSDKNLENYPIIFINAKTSISNVTISVNDVPRTITNADTTMKSGEAWVFMDTFDAEGNSAGEWRINSVMDYRQITADQFEKFESDDSAKYEMIFETKTSPAGKVYNEYRDLVLYFQNDTNVKYGSEEYQIKAGAYTFTKNSEDPTAAIKNISSSSYTQAALTDPPVEELKMEETAVDPKDWKTTRFHFNSNVTVNYISRIDEDGNEIRNSYTISAGDYTFSEPDQQPLTNGYIDIYSDYARDYFGTRFNEGYVDLYSAKAQAYFTNASNYGMLTTTGVTTAQALGWTDANNQLKSGTSHLTQHDLNMICASDRLYSRQSYSTTGDMYFRFEGNGSFTLGNTMILGAKKLTFASSKTIDGTANYGRSHLYFTNSDPTKEAMLVNFKTDVHIKYYDTKGSYHDYYIREGTYSISKAKDTDSYIADLFDENYWKDKRPVDGKVTDPSAGSEVGLEPEEYS